MISTKGNTKTIFQTEGDSQSMKSFKFESVDWQVRNHGMKNHRRSIRMRYELESYIISMQLLYNYIYCWSWLVHIGGDLASIDNPCQWKLLKKVFLPAARAGMSSSILCNPKAVNTHISNNIYIPFFLHNIACSMLTAVWNDKLGELIHI